MLTHGFVVDGKGHKMSKSKGNVVAPQKVMDQYGADILRLWVATTDYSGELTISDEILKRVVEGYRRIRNTLKFLLANLSDFDPKAHALPVADWLEIDRYALAMTRQLQGELQAHYDAYEFHFIVQKLQSFCSEDLGGFYLDILKDRLYTSGADGSARRAAQNALFHIAQALTRWMAPILSFTGEEVWSELSGSSDDSVFLHTWHTLPEQPDEVEHRLQMRWELIRSVRAKVLKEMETQRAAGAIGSSLQAEIDIHAKDEIRAVLDPLGDDLRFVLITSQARVIAAEEDVSSSPRAPRRNASAAGITATTSTRTQTTPACADAASAISTATAKRARMPDTAGRHRVRSDSTEPALRHCDDTPSARGRTSHKGTNLWEGRPRPDFRTLTPPRLRPEGRPPTPSHNEPRPD